ncbi:MAG TPA: sigma-70 family RNA polymerase sigma factor [Tepidisphaeraceae bacterium]|jgi:RNA polymerase sigma-70 factor (ECF subfamily)|nr:sigma-70 family RNA polymerase sigma factor [Tepidisphaeraceae bacterium]
MTAQQILLSSDEELARQARAGSVASFDELARRVQIPLIGFLERRFPSRQDAEDITQETLIRAYQSLARYQDHRRFRTWVFTIAYRIAVSRGRSERPAIEMADDFPDLRENAHESMDRRESSQRIWAVANAVLTEDQVTALWFYYVEDLPAGDIARVMGRSWVSVKTMLHRARKKLHPHLAAEYAPNMMSAPAGESR